MDLSKATHDELEAEVRRRKQARALGYQAQQLMDACKLAGLKQSSQICEVLIGVIHGEGNVS